MLPATDACWVRLCACVGARAPRHGVSGGAGSSVFSRCARLPLADRLGWGVVHAVIVYGGAGVQGSAGGGQCAPVCSPASISRRGSSSACVGAGGSWQMGSAAQGVITCVTACPDRGGDAGGGFGSIGLVGCGGDGAGVCVEACSARAAWRCESASACGGTGGTWRGSQCEAPTAEACARGSSTWCGYAVVPLGIGVLAMVRDRCERVQGYCRNVLVAPEGVTASSMAAARGMWCRCGSVELPICRRMRGSGWRMGGVISGVY